MGAGGLDCIEIPTCMKKMSGKEEYNQLLQLHISTY